MAYWMGLWLVITVGVSVWNIGNRASDGNQVKSNELKLNCRSMSIVLPLQARPVRSRCDSSRTRFSSSVIRLESRWDIAEPWSAPSATSGVVPDTHATPPHSRWSARRK